MEYIKKLNWRRYGKQYYRVFIHYIDEDGNNKRLTCRYDWDGIYGWIFRIRIRKRIKILGSLFILYKHKTILLFIFTCIYVFW